MRRITIAGCLIAGTLIGWYLWPKSNLERSGQDLIASATRGDIEGVLRFIGSEEAKLEAIDAASLREFLEVFVLPKLKRFRPNGPVRTFPDGFNRHLIVQQELINSEGRIVPIGFDMIQTPQGDKCDTVCLSLLDAAAHAVGPDRFRLAGVRRAQASLDNWESLMPELRKLSLQGVACQLGMRSTLTLVTWEDFRVSKTEALALAMNGRTSR